MVYISRKDNLDREEKLKEHLQEVGQLCCKFFKETTIIEKSEAGMLLGLLHDIGKYGDDFQRKIRGETLKVDHSTIGGQIAWKVYNAVTKQKKNAYPFQLYNMAMVYAIMGHHTGLRNFGHSESNEKDIYTRLKKDKPKGYENYKTENDEQMLKKAYKAQLNIVENEKEFQEQFFIRYILSCLVDADRLAAQSFIGLPLNQYNTMKDLKIKFDEYMVQKKAEVQSKILTKKAEDLMTLRNAINEQCLKASQGEKGLYSLTVPTGGGKTLASMAFALNHALKNEQRRIIYTIPFTSIIEQNAYVYRKIFGEQNVLEHHSNYENPFSKDKEDEKEDYERFKLVQSNWDSPIIVTTNVQFFESLFAAKTSKVRKIHNIANSVIILDEVQAIPNALIRPCLNALSELIQNYNCTVVLCSATQPEFDKNHLLNYKEMKCHEIIDNPNDLFEKMRRTKETYIGEQSLENIANALSQCQQVLCIVNTKRHAKDLYYAVKQKIKDKKIYHLSTNMCPEHRRDTLTEIRNCLEQGLSCIVISTQLIEAGVDIDFPIVYRSLTGLDSITQAAGRCNREWTLEDGQVYVFKPEEDEYQPVDYLKTTADVSYGILQDTNKDFLELDILKSYFKKLYSFSTSQDKNKILDLCKQKKMQFPFEDIEKAFKLIENQEYALIIPYNDVAENLINQLKRDFTTDVLKKLIPFTINLQKKVLESLQKNNAIEIINDEILILKNRNSYYNDQYGIDINE